MFWDFGSLHQKHRVGGTHGRVRRDGSDGWRSPVPRGDNTGGRGRVLPPPTIRCQSRRQVQNILTHLGVDSVRDGRSSTPRRVRRCGVISHALSRQPELSPVSLRRFRLGVPPQATETSHPRCFRYSQHTNVAHHTQGAAAKSTPLTRRKRLRDQRLSRHHCVAVYTGSFRDGGTEVRTRGIVVASGTRFPRVRTHAPAVLSKGTWSRPGSRGLTMAFASFARRAFVLRRFTDTVPLAPVQLQSMELPATTVGEWWRRHSL